MITSEISWDGYRNEITYYLDKYLIGVFDDFDNYIYPTEIDNKWLIRVPGATRGHIQVVQGKIADITLYRDSFCYKEEVLDNINQFIGKEIDLGKDN